MNPTVTQLDGEPDLSLVIPCYNESGHLRESVAVLVEVLELTSLSFEIVFVDDGSQDETRQIIDDICAITPRCRSIFHERNRGRGAAFKTGFAATTGRVCGFIDIDLEVHALFIPWLVNLIVRHDYDIATGFRHYLLSQTGSVGLLRHVLSRCYRIMCRFALGLGVHDSETGCKFFRRSTATTVVLGSESDGWFWDTEVMARASLANLRIVEMPVLFLRRRDKKSTVRLLHDMKSYLKEIHRFRGKIGLSLTRKSPVYWTPLGYDTLMRVLYRGQYQRSYKAVAQLIPNGASVLDVCCGTGKLYAYLREKNCTYAGLDFNSHFLLRARNQRIDVRFCNVLAGRFPSADYVVMCSSFYQFWRSREEVFAKMMAAARRAVIISEPVQNLSRHRVEWIGKLANKLTDPGVGEFDYRCDLESFAQFAREQGAARIIHLEGDRNAIAVFETAPSFVQIASAEMVPTTA